MRRIPSVRPTTAIASLVLILSLGACSLGSDDTTADRQSPDDTSAAGESPSAAPSGEPGSPESAGLDPNNLPEPVASATVPARAGEGDQSDATMTVELLGLSREGRTVVGQFAFTIDAAAGSEPNHLYHYLGNSGWAPFFIDNTNLKRHRVLSDSSGVIRAQTDYMGGKFGPGQTFYAFAVFAAPPEDVTEVDVAMVDGAPLATGITVQ